MLSQCVTQLKAEVDEVGVCSNASGRVFTALQSNLCPRNHTVWHAVYILMCTRDAEEEISVPKAEERKETIPLAGWDADLHKLYLHLSQDGRRTRLTRTMVMIAT